MTVEFLFGVICVICFIVFAKLLVECYSEFGFSFVTILCPPFTSALVGIALTMLLTVYNVATETVDHTESEKIELYGLSNSSGNAGTFMLGSGTINNENYIFYNSKTPEGLFKTEKVKMDNCLFDTPSDSTYLEKVTSIHTTRLPATDFDVFGISVSKPLRDYTYIFHLRKEDMNITNYYDISKF